MFIQLTHDYSGEKTFLRADSIHTIREKADGRTLIVGERGMYVREDPFLIMDMIESVTLNENVKMEKETK